MGWQINNFMPQRNTAFDLGAERSEEGICPPANGLVMVRQNNAERTS